MPYWFLFFLLFPFGAASHPLHLTVSHLEFQRKSRVMELSIRLFDDDLALALSKRFPEFSKKDANDPEIMRFARTYLGEKVEIRCDGKRIPPASWKFIKREQSEGATVIYFQLPWSGCNQAIYVRNELLLECFPDQKNLWMVSDGERSRGYEFCRDQRFYSIHLPIEAYF